MIDPKWESVLNRKAIAGVVTSVILPCPGPELFELELREKSASLERAGINKYLKRMIGDLDVSFERK